MLFSVILIAVFIVVAFMVIKHFLNIGDCAKLAIFLDDFQSEITKTWNANSGTFPFEKALPGGIEYVCFADFSESIRGSYVDIGEDLSIYEGNRANLFFYPPTKACDIPIKYISHIDIPNTIKNENPYCIKAKAGKINMVIKKGFNQNVTVLRE